MTTRQPGITIERIDHGVLPANDLGRAFRFWANFMGARLNFLTNMNARGLNREVPLIVFFTVANHSGFGIALQDFPLSASPARPQEGVVWAFEMAATDLSAAIEAAEKQSLVYDASNIRPGVRCGPLFSSSIPRAIRSSSASEKIHRSWRRKERWCRFGASAMCASR